MHTSSPHDYIGKIVKIRLPYYDLSNSVVSYKVRPGLIIGCEKDQFPCDFTYLPISKINDQRHRHTLYDLKVDANNCNLLSLNHIPSFIRCHKVGTIYCTNVHRNEISDLNDLNPQLFNEIKSVFKMFANDLF